MKLCLADECRGTEPDDRTANADDPDKKAEAEHREPTCLSHWSDSEWEVRIMEQIARHAAMR